MRLFGFIADLIFDVQQVLVHNLTGLFCISSGDRIDDCFVFVISAGVFAFRSEMGENDQRGTTNNVVKVLLEDAITSQFGQLSMKIYRQRKSQFAVPLLIGSLFAIEEIA